MLAVLSVVGLNTRVYWHCILMRGLIHTYHSFYETIAYYGLFSPFIVGIMGH